MLKCTEVREYISDYLDGELAEEKREDFEKHISECSSCFAFLNTLKKTISFYQDEEFFTFPFSLHKRIMEIMEEAMKLFPSSLRLNRIEVVDIIDRKDSILVKALLPGVDKKDISISVKEDILTIQGKSSKKKEIRERNYYHAEIRKGAFSRTLTLPSAVNEDKVKAIYKNGVLEIILPKIEKKELPQKQIKIE